MYVIILLKCALKNDELLEKQKTKFIFVDRDSWKIKKVN